MAKNGEEKFAGYPLSRFEGMTDGEILGVPRVGPATLAKIQAAQAAGAETAEPEAVEVASPKTCRGCKEELPEGWKYPYCKKCHEGWQRQNREDTREAIEEALKRVHEFLQNNMNWNPWYDYTPAIELFEKATADYKARRYQGMVGFLHREVKGKANEITADGDLGYIGRLITKGELKETDELRELREAAEGLFANGKFGEASRKAREAKRLAGQLRRGQEEAKREELLETLTFEPQSQRKRGQWRKKGAR